MQNKKILLVDDNPVYVKGMSTRLRKEGFEVFSAQDGSGAVSVLRQEKPDLILLDINFPPDIAQGGGLSWDGFLIMDWLRRMGGATNIPVLLITGGNSAEYAERAQKSGAAGLFQKSGGTTELMRLIHQFLN